MSNIVLTGLSGSGKTTLARILTQELGMRCIDTDREIERETGMPISQLFARYGEDHFRDLESAAIERASGLCRTVIATGGGAVLREENMRSLGRGGMVIFLDRPVERIMSDLSCDNRPLLKNGAQKLYEMERVRRERYESTADIIFHNVGSLEEAKAELLAIVRARRPLCDYAVIGEPIGHSLSPAIHKAVFDVLRVERDYKALHVPRGTLAEFMDSARHSPLEGFNVTIPHKKDIIPLLDVVEPDAARCGAVNTVVRKNGRWHGYNTDMPGLSAAIRDCGREYRGSRVTVLGTGGASCAVVARAAAERATEVRVHGRRREAAAEAARLAGGRTAAKTGDLGIDALRASAANSDILINTLPLEMTGVRGGMIGLDFLEALPRHALVCDLVYSPPRTELLRRAESLGLSTQNGLPMLIYQAIIADTHYLGRELDCRALYEIVCGVLNGQREEAPAA